MDSKPEILVVEDTKEIQILVTSILKTKFKVKVAANAEEAIKATTAQAFALIVLDIGLPDGDGHEIYEKIHQCEKNKTTPVVFLTGKKDLKDKMISFSQGAVDYITKPIDPIDFLKRIESKVKKSS